MTVVFILRIYFSTGFFAFFSRLFSLIQYIIISVSKDGTIEMKYTPQDMMPDDHFKQVTTLSGDLDINKDIAACRSQVPKLYVFSCEYTVLDILS